MSTDQPTTTPAGEPAPAGTVQGTQSTVTTDVSGQSAPAPDTVGVDAGQQSTQGDPTAPGIQDPSAPTQVTATDGATTTDQPAPDQSGMLPGVPVGDTTAAPAADVVTSPPEDTADLPAWASNETADPVAIRQIQQGTGPERPEEVPVDTTLPEGNEAVQQAGDVYVSPADPELGEPIARWLERQAARDPRLSPVVERLVLLDNVFFRFSSDDPVLARPAAPAATETAAA